MRAGGNNRYRDKELGPDKGRLRPWTGCFRAAAILAGITTLALSAGAFRRGAGGRCHAAAYRRVSDMSSLYADIGGPGSFAAAKMAVEDFLAGPHKMKRQIEVLGGDHMNKADLGVNIAREWIDRNNVEAIIDVPNSSVALAVRNIVQQANKVILVSGVFVVRPDREILLAESGPLELRYLCAVRRGRRGRWSAGRRQELVHADRRLRVRTRDGGGSQERGSEARRHSRRRRPHADQQPGLFLVPASGPGIESASHRIDQCGRRHDQLDQAVGRVRHSAGRPAGRGDRALSQRRALPRTEGRARAAVHRVVLLGPERGNARLGKAFRPAQQRPLSDGDAGGRLCRDTALSESGGRSSARPATERPLCRR